jgi:hypothetical protein
MLFFYCSFISALFVVILVLCIVWWHGDKDRPVWVSADHFSAFLPRCYFILYNEGNRYLLISQYELLVKCVLINVIIIFVCIKNRSCDCVTLSFSWLPLYYGVWRTLEHDNQNCSCAKYKLRYYACQFCRCSLLVVFCVFLVSKLSQHLCIASRRCATLQLQEGSRVC